MRRRLWKNKQSPTKQNKPKKLEPWNIQLFSPRKFLCTAPLAQWIEHWTSDPGVMGSTPIWCTFCFYALLGDMAHHYPYPQFLVVVVGRTHELSLMRLFLVVVAFVALGWLDMLGISVRSQCIFELSQRGIPGVEFVTLRKTFVTLSDTKGSTAGKMSRELKGHQEKHRRNRKIF